MAAMSMSRLKTLFSVIGGAWLVAVVILVGCGKNVPEAEAPVQVAWMDQPAAFVGRDSCGECHEGAMQRFTGSHHDLAMDHATEETVIGDFDDATFTYNGITSRFYRRDGKYYVETEGGDGTMQEFLLSYTFGVIPLQQYLVEFPDGRLQALGLAWDSNPVELGGQRWFHLYPGEKVDHKDVLHWTRVSQNWNYMCADCHSTKLRKGYDEVTNTYKTTWSEIDVSCEACHGPASRHLAWAEENRNSTVEAGDEYAMGLVNALRDGSGGHWQYLPDDPIARRTVLPDNDHQVETCAKCHSLRTQLRESPRTGQPLLDDYDLRLLDEGLYFADGQILSEVYVYGSFRQSKMALAGVRCTDCHDPHSLNLKAPGNAACASCHLPSTYDTPDHHFHQRESTGAQCVECHMPASKYMVVDPRRDHSFRVPRPDLTLSTDAPNACNRCHEEEDAAWSLAACQEWYGEDWPLDRHYGEAFHAGRIHAPDAIDLLHGTVTDSEEVGIVRATATTLLGQQRSPELLSDLLNLHQDPDPLIRIATANATAGLPPANRMEVLAPLLDDPLLSVRLEAVSQLMDVPGSMMTEAQSKAREKGFEEFTRTQKFNADHPSARVRLGYFYHLRGDNQRAEEAYRGAIEIEPGFVPAYVNLADLFRQSGRDAEGEVVLRAGLLEGEAAGLYHALGLLQVRDGRLEEAIDSLGQAYVLDPADPRLGYVYAVGLQSTGKLDRSIEVLDETLERHPNDRDLLVASMSYLIQADRRSEAQERADQLLQLEPDTPGIRELIRSLGLAAR